MPEVKLRYGGIDFDVKTDSIQNQTPTPLVTIETTPNKDFDGNILSISNTINLQGTILGSCFSGCISSYSGVVDFFSDNRKQGKTFEIIMDGNVLLSYSGTYLESIGTSNSNNNWAVTIPYTVSLRNIFSDDLTNGLIESFDDSWTIEPLEEVSYFNNSVNNVDYYSFQYNNASNSSPPSQRDLLLNNNKTLGFSNFLQYRIVHRLGAVGRAVNRSNAVNPLPGPGITTDNYTSLAYMEASKWVMNRASKTLSGLYSSEISLYNGSINLYNHIRNIETSISNGTYSLTDTWLALGTGVKYTEEFTCEITTDEKYLKTVSLNGTIRGLEQSSNGYVAFDNISMTGNISNNFGLKFSKQNAANNKFNNAVNAYNSGVKPYLYHRASQVMYSMDNTPVKTSGVPTNWIIRNSGPLNISPISYTESLNPNAGSISYNVSYSNKPGSWILGALSTSINISDDNSADQVAENFVLGRPLGPILEKVGKTKNSRNLSMEIVYPTPRTFEESHPQSPQCVLHPSRDEAKQLLQLIEAYKPVGAAAFQTLVGNPSTAYPISNNGSIYQTKNNKIWDAMEGRLSWQIEWVYSSGC